VVECFSIPYTHTITVVHSTDNHDDAECSLSVGGMSCTACARRIEKAVSALKGVKTCAVNLAAGSARIQYDPRIITTDRIMGAISDIGYDPAEMADDDGEKSLEESQKAGERTRAIELAAAIALTIPVAIIGMFEFVCLHSPRRSYSGRDAVSSPEHGKPCNTAAPA